MKFGIQREVSSKNNSQCYIFKINVCLKENCTGIHMIKRPEFSEKLTVQFLMASSKHLKRM